MKRLFVLCASLLTGCASINGIGTISPQAVPTVAKVLDKQTIIEREIDRRPMMYSGARWHRGGFYDPFFGSMMNYETSVREQTSYRYTLNLKNNEALTLNSPYDLDVGQCVTVWRIPSSDIYPRVDKNPECKLPEPKK